MKLTKAFVDDLRELIVSARASVVRGVDLVQVHTNFEIGRRIVQQEQRGKNRATYGEEVIKVLAARLSVEFGTGFSKSNLEYMRRFYLVHQNRARIAQTTSGQSKAGNRAVASADAIQTASFRLSWSHYVFLLGIKDFGERNFYEIEAAQQNWTLRELKRQFDASLYERLALSRDKMGVRRLAREVRLRSVQNAGGGSQCPNAGEPKVSVRGHVSTPGPRVYQVLYRNVATFCSPAPFNLTNGIEVLWQM